MVLTLKIGDNANTVYEVPIGIMDSVNPTPPPSYLYGT